WMEETDIDGYTLHAADQYDPAFLQDLTSKIKEKHPNFYLIATALQEDSQVDSLFDNEDLDAISNPEMYEAMKDRKSTRLNSSHVSISYAVFCLKKKRQ